MEMRLIVNADDFGKNKEVNQAICEAFGRGVLSQTTLMVNMPYAKEAVELAQANGFAHKVGLHLNLTEGEPLSEDIRRMSRFCDENGRFHAGFHLHTRSRLYMGCRSVLAVRKEAEAQLARYQAFGLKLGHLDSHHHVHTDHPVYQAIRPLLFRYGIRSMRISRNLFDVSGLSGIYKDLYNQGLRRAGLITADYFGSFEDMKESGCALTCKKGVLELMLHPMYDTNGVLMDTGTPMGQVERCLRGQLPYARLIDYGELGI